MPNIYCYAVPESDGCKEGDVRLADGQNDNEGRIEICYQGVWGTVCGDGFDFPDGFVACKNDDVSGMPPNKLPHVLVYNIYLYHRNCSMLIIS